MKLIEYYLFEQDKELRKFDNHHDAFEEYEKSIIIPRAVVKVDNNNKYFTPINKNYSSFDFEQEYQIKKQFYDMNLRYKP